MRIVIETIPHSQQRYETVGDYWWDDYGIQIRVSNTKDIARDTLLIVHEVVESLLCLNRGITQEQIDAFDMKFETNRPEGDTSEPGDETNAPYRREHCTATGIERMLAAELGVDWKDYENQIDAFSKDEPKT